MERLNEYSKTPKNLTDAQGDFFNEEQWRLERRYGREVICWHSLESLHHLANLPEQQLKRIISGCHREMGIMLANFFFPGWQFNAYLKTGKPQEF